MSNLLHQTVELLWAERHQYPKKVITQSKILLRQAKLNADSIAIGLAYRNLGYMDLIGGNLESAWDRLTAALETGRRYDLPELVAESSNFLAGVYRGMGNLNTALQYLENAIYIQQTQQQPESLVPLKYNIGTLLQDLGRHEEAISAYFSALEILQEFPNPVRHLEVNGNVAMSYTALGRYDEAVMLFQNVIKEAEQRNLKQHQVRNLVNFGEAYTKMGRYHQALQILYQALQMIEVGVTPEGKIYCLLNIAEAQKCLLDWQEALDSLEDAKKIALKLKIIPIQAQIAHAQYLIYKSQHRPKAALEAFEIYHKIHEQQRQHNVEQELRLFTLERDFEKTIAEAEMSRIKNIELSELLGKVQEANNEKAKLLEELGIKTQELQILATRDALTGLYNRHYLEQVLAQELKLAKTGQYPLSVALIDLDNFKQVNDQFSHQIGDQVLAITGELMRNTIRSKDTAARYGGEELVLVLPKASLSQATTICERLRLTIEKYPWFEISPQLRVTASIGITSDTNLESHEKLLNLADLQMYQAKRLGKNQVSSQKKNPTLTGLILED